jgi:hypothetical protein
MTESVQTGLFLKNHSTKTLACLTQIFILF